MIGPHTLSVHTEALARARAFARRRLDVVDQVDAGAPDVAEYDLTARDYDNARDRMTGGLIALAGVDPSDRTKARYIDVMDCLDRLAEAAHNAARPVTQGALF